MPKCRSRILRALGATTVSVLLLLSMAAFAAEEEEKKPASAGPYGWQVMTEEEKVEYRRTLEGLSTPETRASYRVEHREKMKARAREQGVDISGRSGPKQGGDEARGKGGKGNAQGKGGRGNTRARAGQGEAGARRPLGWEIMTEEERGAYKDNLQNLETREERTAFREQHRDMMEARAAETGVSLRPPDAGQPRRGGAGGGQEQLHIYGEKLMSEDERNAYADKIQAFKTLEERKEFRQDHVAEMQRRAKEQGVHLPRPGAGRAGQGGATPGAKAEDDGS